MIVSNWFFSDIGDILNLFLFRTCQRARPRLLHFTLNLFCLTLLDNVKPPFGKLPRPSLTPTILN